MNKEHMTLTVSQIARHLVYGSKPRTPNDKPVSFREMRDYVDSALSVKFGQYTHGITYGNNVRKFTKIYHSSSGSRYNIVAIPDSICPAFITEEKCTFNSWKSRDLSGEIQLQLEGFVCDNKLGLLKVRHLSNNEVIYHAMNLDDPTATELIEKYLRQSLLPYI